jgi:hypothetical protein
MWKVFTARYVLNSCIKQTRLVFKRLNELYTVDWKIFACMLASIQVMLMYYLKTDNWQYHLHIFPPCAQHSVIDADEKA